jgi:hypothetical protein
VINDLCLACAQERARKRTNEHPGYNSAVCKRWRKNNPDKVQAIIERRKPIVQQWHQDHPDRGEASRQKWNEENEELNRQLKRDWNFDQSRHHQTQRPGAARAHT